MRSRLRPAMPCRSTACFALPCRMKVREKGPKDQPWIEALLNARWGGGGKVIVHGEVFDAGSLSGLIAAERMGLATFQIRRVKDMAVAELIRLDAITAGQGVGTALIEALLSRLSAEGVEILRVTTTNDNLSALRFYQRRDFRITKVRPAAVDDTRRLKTSIPIGGRHWFPIRAEIQPMLSVQ